jgi:glycosyltransferase involved in cell wall biosynthesis
MAGTVTVSVVVASHARELRLRWLLNALEEQTLARESWEVVVVHDYDAAVAERVIERHPLFESGTLRHRAIEPGTGSPARQRNIGWRMGRGRLVAFTDDDCRPEPGWLAALA